MINLTEIHQFHSPFVSAASGLVSLSNFLYLIADDDLSLIQIALNDLSGKSYPLFPGVLPEEKKERKKLKPDLESLTLTNLGLLAIPSGSKKNRTRGAFIPMKNGLVNGPVEQLDFSVLFSKLDGYFDELNIEGAIIIKDQLRLFQRGNGPQRVNAIIDVDLKDKNSIKNLANIQLGLIDTIPLSFTDATLYKNVIYFLAVAENSQSTYEDGEVTGSILGIMGIDGEILKTVRLNCTSKPEGLTIKENIIYIVTDDDDRTRPSKLLRARLDDFILQN